MAKSAAPRASTSTRKKASSLGASAVNRASTVNSAPTGSEASTVQRAATAPRAATEMPSTLAAPSEPSREQIAERAYGLWLSRGAHEGDAFGDWLRAERELREQN